jgi:hypothetical protein
VGHAGRARREDRQVVAALPRDPQLVALDRLADLIVADPRLGGNRQRRVLQPGELGVAKLLEGGRCRRVVTVTVNERTLPAASLKR